MLEVHQAKQWPQFFNSCGLLKVSNQRHVWVTFLQAPLAHHVTEKFYLLSKPTALLHLNADVITNQRVQDLLHQVNMLIKITAHYQCIININQYMLSVKVMQNFLYLLVKSTRGIFQAKTKELKLIMMFTCRKSCVLLAIWVQFNLIVTLH